MDQVHMVFEGMYANVPPGYRVPEMTGAAYEINNPYVFALTMDVRILGNSQATPMDYIRTPIMARLLGCKQNPQAVTTLLMMLFEVLANNGMARAAVDGEKIQSKECFKVGMIHIPCVDVLLEPLFHKDDLQRIVGYRWWFFVLDKSINMNRGLEALIMRTRTAKRKATTERTGTETEQHPAATLIESIKDIATFIDLVLRGVMRDLAPGDGSYHLSITEDVNNANIYRLLSLEQSIPASKIMRTNGDEKLLSPTGEPLIGADGHYIHCTEGIECLDAFGNPIIMPRGEPMHDANGGTMYETLVSGTLADLHPDQMNLDLYRTTQNGVGGLRTVYRFPMGGTRLHWSMHNPGVIYRMRLFEDETSEQWRHSVTADMQQDHLRAAIIKARTMIVPPRPPSDAMDDDDSDAIHKINADLVRGKTPVEARAIRESRAMSSRVAMLFDPQANIGPAYKAALGHMDTLRHQARVRGTVFKANTNIIPLYDPKMSWFANAQIHFALQLENICHVAVLHQELIQAHVAAMSVFEHLRGLKLNIIYAGSAEAGKSLILKATRDVMITGTWCVTSRKTKQSELTEINKDGMVEFEDELQDSYFVEDGDGQDKERLTEGIMRTQMTFISDKGKRLCVITISRHSGVFMAATNKLGISVPMKTRHVIQPISTFDPREDRGPTHSMIGETNQKNIEIIEMAKDMHKDIYRMRQMLICMVYEFIYAGKLMAPDLTVADIVIVRFMAYLREGGIMLAPRDFWRIHRAIIELVIENAIHIVFFTRTIWPEDKEFEVDDIMRVQEFLFATEEITIFALSLFSTMFFHPQEHAIMKSCAENNLGYVMGPNRQGILTNSIARFARTAPCPEHPDGVENKNYIAFEGLASSFMQPMIFAADQIANRMRNVDMTSARAIVEDVLNNLHKRTIRTECYYDEVTGQIIQLEKDMDIIMVKGKSLWINRWYFDKVLNTNTDRDFFDATIRAMQHAHTPRQKIVLGQTMRYSRAKFYPHILRTMELTNKKKGPDGTIVPFEVIEVKDFTRLGAGWLETHYPHQAPQSLKVKVTTDLEQAKWIDYMLRLGRAEEEIQVSPAEPSRLRHAPLMVPGSCPRCTQIACDHRDYPKWYLDATKDQQDKPAEDIMANRVVLISRCGTPPRKKFKHVEEASTAIPVAELTPIAKALAQYPSAMHKAMLEAELARFNQLQPEAAAGPPVFTTTTSST